MGALREYIGERRETRKEMNSLGRENKALDTRINGQAQAFSANYNPASRLEDDPTRNNFQTYPYDYYCGTNAKVFFGDIWVDDIVTIQYNIKQDKEPIYGYASQNFDAIARGTIIVQGSFTIAFKEMGYLNVVTNVLESQLQRSISTEMKRKIQKKFDMVAGGSGAFDPGLDRFIGGQGKDNYVYAPTGQPEIIRQQQTIEDILMYKKEGNVVSSGLSTDTGLPTNDRDFEDFAELLEDTIWGDSNGRPYTTQSRNFRRADEFDYHWEGNRDAGGIKVAEKTENGEANYAKVLNIMITFGDINDFRAEHTMVVLNDVHIVNTAMVVAPTGEPIGETYFFIARDVNQTLSRETIGMMSPKKYNVGLGDEGFKTTTETDIEAIEQFIEDQDNPYFSIKIESLSKFKYTATGAGTWFPDNTYADVFTMQAVNAWDSKIDQIIKTVERNINDIVGKFNTIGSNQDRNSDYSQWIMKVSINNTERTGATGSVGERSTGTSMASAFTGSPLGNGFNIVLDQSIPNTLTYRVISPSRDNFGSVSTFTRGELWAGNGRQVELPKVTDEAPDRDPNAGKVEDSTAKSTQYDAPPTAPETDLDLTKPGTQEVPAAAKQADETTELISQVSKINTELEEIAGPPTQTDLARETTKVTVLPDEAPPPEIPVLALSGQTKTTNVSNNPDYNIMIADPALPTVTDLGIKTRVVSAGMEEHTARGSTMSNDAVFTTGGIEGQRIPVAAVPTAGQLQWSEGTAPVFVPKNNMYVVQFVHVDPTIETKAAAKKTVNIEGNEVYTLDVTAGQVFGTQKKTDIGVTATFSAPHMHETYTSLIVAKPYSDTSDRPIEYMTESDYSAYAGSLYNEDWRKYGLTLEVK